MKVEEIDALLIACAEDKHAEQLVGFVKLGLNTGMRRGEILGIDAKRIDWAAHKVAAIPASPMGAPSRRLPSEGDAGASASSAWARMGRCGPSTGFFWVK